MKYLIAILGIIAFLLLAWAVSFDRQAIKKKAIPLLTCLIIQVLLAAFLINTSLGVSIISSIVFVFTQIMTSASVGIDFVFGGLLNKGEWSFLLSALMPVVFICALIGILKYFKIIQYAMVGLGSALNYVTRVGKMESFSILCSTSLGMAAPFITVREYFDNLSRKQVYALAAASISSIDLSILASYMKIINPTYVVLALFLNVFSFFIILTLIAPANDDIAPNFDIMHTEEGIGFFETLTEHIWDGFKIVGACVAMLIAFIALIDLFNVIFNGIFGVSFQTTLGYIFSPLAFLMGIPWHDCVKVGGIIATKLIANEFVAMMSLKDIAAQLSPRSLAITSVFLISFANFGSIGIIVGIVKGLSQAQAKVVAGFSLRLIYGASLVSLLTATVTSLVL